MVFYRKYRPQTINELDSSDVREALFSVLSKSDIPHAFLFTGPKGLGKTSTARIVAKVVNCVGRVPQVSKVPQGENLKSKDTRDTSATRGAPSIEPCNACEQCVSITAGTNMDVIEMDAASNRGIDEVRELKETIKLAPFSAKRKIYIIDEVHMLTTEAFNALLKTLEEPPTHAMFILCTTELHKVPPTILSRCFHVSFTLATTEELIRSFRRITEGEGIAVDEDALSLIASLSDGGFRDGTKMIEEVASFANGKKITASLVTERYHLKGISKILSELLQAFVSRDVKKGILVLQEATKQGIDMRYLLMELLKRCHMTLLSLAGVQEEKDPTLSAMSLAELIRLSEVLSLAGNEMKYAVIPQLPLELALFEWASGSPNEEVSENTISQGKSSSDERSLSSFRKQVGNIAKKNAVSTDKKEEKKGVSTQGVSILHYSSDGDITKEWLSAFWNSLLDTVKQENHTIAGVLRGCVMKSFDRKTLIIQTAYTFHKERLDESKTKVVLERVCKELTGNPVTVTVELKT